MAEAVAEQSRKPFGGMSPSEAGRRGAEKRWKAQRERAESAPPVDATPRDLTRTPLDALRDLMAADPEAYAAGLGKLVREGDPRSITIMRELFNAKGSVAIPRAESTVRALSTEERRALLLELEARGATLPDVQMSGDLDEHEDASGRV